MTAKTKRLRPTARGASAEAERDSTSPPWPVYRRLRGYAFDPSLSIRLDRAVVNETVYKVMWEDAATNGREGLMPGRGGFPEDKVPGADLLDSRVHGR